MINEKFRPSKKKPIRYYLVSLFGIIVILVSSCIGLASEVIAEDLSEVNVGKFFLYFGIGFIVFSLITYGIIYGVYKNERFYFSDNKLNYEYTFIIKKKIALPLEKINIVKKKRSLIDLILGTTIVEIGSGSMATSMKPEMRLCVTKEFALSFSDYLERYSKAIKENREFIENFHVDEIKENVTNQEMIMMSVSDKFKYIISNPGFITMIILVIIFPLFFLFLNNVAPSSFIDEVNPNGITNIQAFLLGLFIAGMTVLFGLIGIFYHTFVNYYNYTIEKTENGLNISYGLISKKSFSVTYDKIHGYIISKNICHQIFKFGGLKLCVIGMDEQQKQNNGVVSSTFIYPCGNINKLKLIIEMILPDFKFNGTLNKSTKKSIIHTIFIPIVITLLFILPVLIYLAIVINVLILVIPCNVIIIFGLIRRFLVYKHSGFGIENDFICTQTGGFVNNYSIIKTSSVQGITTFAGFMRRKHELCTYLIAYRGSSQLTSKIVVRNIPTISLEKLK